METKADDSPVTEVDRSAEQTVRGLLEHHRPKDAIHGEEFGSKGGGPRQWIIDPVDGTRNYIRGIPVWATLIALLDEGRPVMGVVSAPALGLRWFAAKGDGAWKGGRMRDAKPLHVSAVRPSRTRRCRTRRSAAGGRRGCSPRSSTSWARWPARARSGTSGAT